eukprot:Transcript_12933.p2 GENE.Transcript_12933~~Transcript_12933.p2  ORF type:complete len:284 (-),score=129.10 Transcript_12933:56-907(-)
MRLALAALRELSRRRLQQAQADQVCAEVLHASAEELRLLQAAPRQLSQGGEGETHALGRRLKQLELLRLRIQQEQLESARAAAAAVQAQLRADAARVFGFATQGVYVHDGLALPRFEPAETLLSAARFAPVWARVRALLVAAEKVAQVAHLVRDGRRKTLQEGVQLLVSLEEDDLPTLFAIAKEVVRLSDEAESAADADADANQNGSARRDAPPPRTVWWRQLEEDDEGRGGMHELEDFVAHRHLHQARLGLLQGRVAEATKALDKLRVDFVMFARSAAAVVL